jgi:hypothetical protein
MSTNKLTNLRGREILKEHNRHTNNKDGQDKCYVYKNHITKIRIISDMTRGSHTIIYKSLIYYKGVVESTLQRVLFPQPDISIDIVYTKIVIPYDNAKQSPTYYYIKVINNSYVMLITYMGYYHPPPIFGIPPSPY